MVKKYSLASAVAGLMTGSALLVAQAQQTETPPAAADQAQNAQAEEAQDDEAEADDAEADQQQAEQEEADAAEQEREEQQNQDRQQDEAADRADLDGQLEQDLDAANVPGPRDNVERPAPGIQPRDFDTETGLEGQRPEDRDLRGPQRGPAGFDRQRDFRGEPRDLGMQFDTTEQGQLVVADVAPNAPAAQIGLEQGDRIVSVDGRTFQSGEELNEFLISQRGQRVPIVIERNGERQTVFWTAGEQFPGQREARFGPDPFPGRPGFADPRFRGPGMAQERTFARPALGVSLDADAQGVVVSHVVRHGPACQAGIEVGDRILSMNGQQFQHHQQFVEAAGQLPIGQPVTLQVARNGQVQTVQVQPEPWQTVFDDRRIQQQQQQFAGRPQQFGPAPQWQGQQQFGAQPQWQGQPQFGPAPQQQFGAREQMQFEQRGQFGQFERTQPMGQPYGAARPPLGGMQQNGMAEQEIDELHREIDSLRQQLQNLRQQVESLHRDELGPGAQNQREQLEAPARAPAEPERRGPEPIPGPQPE